MYVFADPELNLEQQHRIASDCTTTVIGETNEMEEFRQICEDYLERYREKAEKELGVAVTSAQTRSIRSGTARYKTGRQFFGDILTYENFKEMLGTFPLQSGNQ